MDAASFREELSRIIQQAARCGLAESPLVIVPGHRPQDLAADIGACRLLVDRLIADELDKRRWLAVEPLQNDVGICVAIARTLECQERRLHPALALQHLRALVEGRKVPAGG